MTVRKTVRKEGIEKEYERSSWKADLIATAIAAVLYLSIPVDLSRIQSVIYIAMYFGIAKAAVMGIERREDRCHTHQTKK